MGYPITNSHLYGQVSNSSLDSIELIDPNVLFPTPIIPLGTIVTVEMPYLGAIELIRLNWPAGVSNTIKVGTIVVWDEHYEAALAMATDANLGSPVALSFSNIPTSAVNDQYAWFVISGTYPVYCGANLAVGSALGLVDSGVGGAESAGLQVLGATVRGASTAAIARDCYTKSLSKTIYSNNGTSGWFVGLVVTGSAITGTVKISAIDPDDRTITLDTAATDDGVSAVTATYNDGSAVYWNIVSLDRPHLQGQDAVAAP